MILYRILILCLLSAGTPTGDRAKQLYKEGLHMKRDGRLDEAQQRFMAAIHADGGYTEAYLELAAVYRLQQQPEPAKQQLLALLDAVPEHPVALQSLAEIFFEQKAYEDALAYAFRAQEQGRGGMYRIIGSSYALLDHPAEAIQALEKAGEEGMDVSCQLARLYAQQENYPQSIRCYENALKADSTSATLYNELGMMHFNMENYHNATIAFEQAAQLSRTGDADLYLNLGMAYLKQANYFDAIRHFRTALDLRPKDIQVMLNLANACYKQQDFTQAITQWNNILMLQPLNAFAMFMLGKSYICSGEVAKGQAICDQALALGTR